MTMPHSKPVRLNRLNKIRKRQGLAPLLRADVLLPPDGREAQRGKRPAPVGVTTLMVPLPTPIREMLTQVRMDAQRADPTIKSSDQLFAGAILTAMLPSMAAKTKLPPLIAAPTKANLEQAHKVGKILARPFNG